MYCKQSNEWFSNSTTEPIPIFIPRLYVCRPIITTHIYKDVNGKKYTVRGCSNGKLLPNGLQAEFQI